MRRLVPLVAALGCGSSAPSTPDAATASFTPVPSTTTVLTATLAIGTRQAVLFVPSFEYDRTRAYALLVNDGQDINALGLALTLDDLWKRQMLQPMLVVALPVSPGGDRLQDYGTAEHDVSIPCDTGDMILGTRAGAYGLYVVRDVLPAAAQAAGVTLAPARTGFLGASLGGLSAFSIAWDHPESFGFAGAMSGSFWWRTTSGTVEDRQNSRIMQNIVARSSARPGFRAWFEAGTGDETADRDQDGIIDAIDDTLDLIAALNAQGLDPVYHEVQLGSHDYATWSSVLPTFLVWAAGP